MSISLTAVYQKVPEGYIGYVEELPGANTQGATLDEARDMGAEALALHLEGLAADGEAAPEPSSLEEIMKEAQNKDGVAVLIAAPAADGKIFSSRVTASGGGPAAAARRRRRRSAELAQ